MHRLRRGDFPLLPHAARHVEHAAAISGPVSQLRALQAVLVPVRPGCPSPSSLTVHSPNGTDHRILAHNTRDGFTFSTLRRLPEDEALIIYVVRRAGGVQLALANGGILFTGLAPPW